MDILLTILLSVTAFLATNLDDIFVLMIFFTRKDYSKLSVVIGQYLGIALLILISSLSIFFKFIIPPSYIALLGLLPIFLGLKKLWDLNENSKGNRIHKKLSFLQGEDNINSKLSHSKILQVTAVTFSNGGDNLGVYVPLFLSMSIFQIGLTSLIFLLMVGLWCILAYLMVSNKIIGNNLERYGHIILPIVLIFIGIMILIGDSLIFPLKPL